MVAPIGLGKGSSRDLSQAASGASLLDFHWWMIDAVSYPANAHSCAMAVISAEANQ